MRERKRGSKERHRLFRGRVLVLGVAGMLCVMGIARGAEGAAAEGRPVEWGAWKPLMAGGHPLAVSYYSVFAARQPGEVELWFDAEFPVQGRNTTVNAVIGLKGKDFSSLDRTMPRFDASLVKGYPVDLGGRDTPILSRTQVTRLADGRYVAVVMIGPQYRGGASELYPVFFVSPDGKQGTWSYLGAPRGEPEEALKNARSAKTLIRCEGGSLIQEADGSLRLYIGWQQGQRDGVRMALLQAKTLDGPWTFRRNRKGGGIADLAEGMPGGWLFPAVTKIPGRGYLMTGGNTWPPERIDCAISADGLTFRPFSATPDTPEVMLQRRANGGQRSGDGSPATVLLRADEVVGNARSLKSVRVMYDPSRDMLIGVANPFAREGGHAGTYPLYWSEGRFTDLWPKGQAEGQAEGGE